MRVRAVHFVSDCTSNLLVAEFPASVRVPDTVWFAESVIVSVLVAVPVRVRVVKVFAPDTVCEVPLSWTS